MRKVRFFCDKCGKEVKYLKRYTFPGYKYDEILGKYAGDIKTDIEVEICDECVEKIRKEFNFHQN